MKRVYNTFFFTVALLLIKACSGYNSFANGPQTYDVGCYAKILEFYPLGRWEDFYRLPDCMIGGIFRNVQCSLYARSSSCYCAYYDTGEPIPDTRHFPQLYGYGRMLQECPIRTQKKTNYCSVPQVHYRCTVTEKKYVYNSKTRTCEAKEYGCEGHKTLELCEKQCVPKVYDKCSFAANEGRRCSQRAGIRYRHNTITGACETFFYKGCGGNSNNYKYQWECKRSCVEQVAVEFQVEVDFSQTYNVTALSWVLEKFDLKRKEINLITIEKWNLIRAHNISFTLVDDNAGSVDRSLSLGSSDVRIPYDKKNNCFAAAKTGPCRAYIPRWYFNRTESQCQLFIYGGCFANKNNYETSDECTKHCNPSKPIDNKSSTPAPGAGNNPDGMDVYLEEGASVVLRLQPASTTRAASSRDPYARNFLLSDGPSGEGST